MKVQVRIMLNCFLVGIGGFSGSVCRYLIGLLPIETGNGFPIKTLMINIVGSFLICLFTILATKNKELSPQVILMLKTGICGGFTTFSTFAFETSELISNGHTITSFIYVCASIILSVLAIFLAQVLIK